MTTTPLPENIGDIYRLVDYCATGLDYLAASYKGTCPLEKDKWCWFLEASDGDYYHWHKGWTDTELQDETMSSRVELVRRNPLEEAARGTTPETAQPGAQGALL